MRFAAFSVVAFAGCIATAIAGESADAQKGKAAPSAGPTLVFSQVVAFSAPQEFTGAFEDRSATGYLKEFVLKGETADKWSQKISLSGAKATAADPQASSLSVLQGAAGRFQRRCPTSFVVKPIGVAPAGTAEGFAAIMGCGSVKPGAGAAVSEIALVVALKGSPDDYTIQWAEHGPAANQAPELDETKWRARFEQLLPIRVCNPEPNEAAPYPSCR
jgi:hypothetical protein